MTTVAFRPDLVDQAPRETAGDMVAVLRAVGVTLLVLSQGWLLLNVADLSKARPLDALVRSGNLGVTVLLTCTGFAVAQSLSRVPASGRVPGQARVLLRYLLGASALLVLVVSAVAVVAAVDSTDATSSAITQESLGQVLSLNWNSYVRSHPLAVRPDVVGLWYVSVEAQLVLALTVLMAVLARTRRTLIGVLAVGFVALSVWRWWVMDAHGWFQAGLRTDARADAFVLGALVALLVEGWRADPDRAAAVTGGAMLLVPGVVLSSAYATVRDFYQGQSAAMAMAVALVLGASVAAGRHTTVFRIATVVPLRDLGRSWLAALAFAGPVFYTLARHSAGWSAPSKALIGFGVLAGAVYVFDQALRPAVLAAVDSLRALRARSAPSSAPEDARSGAEVADVDRGAGGQ